jgi:hypothetical protein
MPLTAARRRYSPTVDRLSPVVMAICRSLTPRACLNLRTSHIFRIGALSAGIGPPLAWPQRAPRPRFDRRQRELQAAPTRVAGFNRNGWPASVGIGGRHRIGKSKLIVAMRCCNCHVSCDGYGAPRQWKPDCLRFKPSAFCAIGTTRHLLQVAVRRPLALRF